MVAEHWQVNEPTTLELAQVRRATITLMGGSLTVTAHDGTTTELRIDGIVGRDIQVEVDGDELRINHPQLDWQQPGEAFRTLTDPPVAHLQLAVPARTNLKASAAGASLVVAGVDGDITLNTTTGEQLTDRTSGSLSLTSVSGDVAARDHSGTLNVKTSHGSITASGAITEFSVNTVAGNTVLQCTDPAVRGITHNSVTGALTLQLPAGANPSYQLRTITAGANLGDVVVEPLHGRRFNRIAGRPGRETLVRLNSVSGAIDVRTPVAPKPWKLNAESPVDFTNAPRVRRVGGEDARAESAADGAAPAAAPQPGGAHPTEMPHPTDATPTDQPHPTDATEEGETDA